MEKLMTMLVGIAAKRRLLLYPFKILLTSTTMSCVVKRLLEHFDITKLWSEETTHEWFEISKELKPPY
jgi:hypothetical protein